MRTKHITFFLLFWVFTGYSQAYKPLLDNVNEWHFTTCYFGCLTDVYYTDGDTLFNGKQYKILDGFHYISRTFLLREDLATKQVFLNIVSEPPSNDYLLYDFSLQEGEEFDMKNPISPFPAEGGYFILDSIRFRTLEDGNDYRHYYFSPSPTNTNSTHNAVWVEGLGSLSLVNAPGGFPDVNGVGKVSCFFKNGQPFYANLDSINDCTPTLGVPYLKDPFSSILVTQDRLSGKVMLHGLKEVVRVEVFDLAGKKMLSRFSNGSTTQEIDGSSFAKGMYLIKIQNRLGKVKIIKFLAP